jgi:hypothetical protein
MGATFFHFYSIEQENQQVPEEAMQQPFAHEDLSPMSHLLLRQLASLCTDPRPECRNTSVQTLFRAISMTYGPFWNESEWRNIWKTIIFPVISLVHSAARSVRKQIHSVEIIQLPLALMVYDMNKNEIPRLTVSDDLRDLATVLASVLDSQGDSSQTTVTKSGMQSYSRTTVLKQWDETKILALTGVSNVVCEYYDFLLSIPGFAIPETTSESIWKQLLTIYRQTFCGLETLSGSAEEIVTRHSHEVAITSIKGLRQVLQSAAKSTVTGDHVDQVWLDAWRSWLKMGRGIHQRKAAVLCSLRSVEPLLRSLTQEQADIHQQRLTDWVDLIYKEETLVLFLDIFYEIWTILTAKAGDPLIASPTIMSPTSMHASERKYADFGIFELKEFYRVLRVVLTYFDLTYFVTDKESDIGWPTDHERILCEFAAIGPNPLSKNVYSRIQATDAERLTSVQRLALLYIVGQKMMIELAGEDQDVGVFSSAENEKSNVAGPAMWQIVLDHTRDQAIAGLVMDELGEVLSFSFRRSCAGLNLQGFEADGGHISVIATDSPVSLASTLERPVDRSAWVQQDMVAVTAEQMARVQWRNNIQDIVGIRLPTFIKLGKCVLKAIASLFGQSMEGKPSTGLSRYLRAYMNGSAERLLKVCIRNTLYLLS